MLKYALASLLFSLPVLAQANQVGCAGIGKSDLGFSTRCLMQINAEPVDYLFSMATFSNSKEAQQFCNQQPATPNLVDDQAFYSKLWMIRPTSDLLAHLKASYVYGGETQSDYFIMWNPISAEEVAQLEALLANPVAHAKFESQIGHKVTGELANLILWAFDMGSGNSWTPNMLLLEKQQKIASGLKLPAICTSSN